LNDAPPPPCDSPGELTPDWLTRALRSAGADVEVVATTWERVGTGQMGTSYRLRLDHAEAEAAQRSGAPGTLIAKMGAGPLESRGVIANGYRAEVGFYRELAGSVSVSTPRCWYAGITDDSTRFTLLLEDLAPAVPGRQVDGLTATQAEMAVVNLAGLHGPVWGDPSLHELGWLQHHTAESAAFTGEILAGAIPTFLERFEPRMGPVDPDTLRRVPEHVEAWLMARPERFSLLHGDYRPDNLMFLPDDAGVSALDWQTLSVGLPGRDVGYLLATSLEPDLRRAEQRRLVEAYRAALGAHGVELTSEECFDDACIGTLQAPLITVLGAVYATDPNPGSDAMFTAMITRARAAIRDLDAFSRL
jgi:hypothetical protein